MMIIWSVPHIFQELTEESKNRAYSGHVTSDLEDSKKQSKHYHPEPDIEAPCIFLGQASGKKALSSLKEKNLGIKTVVSSYLQQQAYAVL